MAAMIFNNFFRIFLGFYGVNSVVGGPDLDRATRPIIEEKTCDHVIFTTNVQYSRRQDSGSYRMYYDADHWDYLGVSGMYADDDYKDYFLVFKQEGQFYDYISFRADPIPQAVYENHTMYITFRFPDERNQYTLALRSFRLKPTDISSPFPVGKSRCYPEKDVIGCDPYCVCNTVVQKTCAFGQPIKGMCSDLGSVTANLARYTFNGTCPPEPNRHTDFSPVTSSSTPSSSKHVTSTTSQAKSPTASQISKATIGIIAGGIISFASTAFLVLYIMKKKGAKTSIPKGDAFQKLEDSTF